MGQFLFHFSLLFLVSTQFVWGQNASLERYHQEDGLPNDLVKSLAMDSLGFIWVATDDGLAKIEGRNIIDVRAPQMFSNNYKSILRSKKFGMLALADPGLMDVAQDYKGIHAKYFNESHNILNWSDFRYPKTLYESLDSVLWIADIGRLYRIKDNQMTTFKLPSKNQIDHFTRSFQFFELDRDHFFVLSQAGYLYQLNKDTDAFVEIPWNYFGTPVYHVQRINSTDFLIGCAKGILKLVFDANGFIRETLDLNFEYPVSVIRPNGVNKFVLGTWSNGAFTLDVNASQPIFLQMDGSENQVINDILVDKQRQVWLGTDLGLLVFRHTVFKTPFENLSNRYIRAIEKGADRTMFFSDGEFVFRASDKHTIEKFYASAKDWVISLATDEKGVWMGTAAGKVIFKKNDGNIRVFDFSDQGQAISGLMVDKKENIWILQSDTSRESLLKMDQQGKVSNLTPRGGEDMHLRFLKLSPEGVVYVGGTGKNDYLFRYDDEKDVLENLSVFMPTQYNEALSVNDIAFVDGSHLLLATNFGIWKYENKDMSQLDLGDVSNEMVTALVCDKQQRIWFANSNGILRLEDSVISVYHTADGLPSKTTNYRCLRIDKNDNLWVGSISGIAVGKISKNEKRTSTPIISSIEKSGLPVDIQKVNRFVQNSLLNITIACPEYPAKYIIYQYLVVKNGEKNTWIDLPRHKDNIILDNLKKGDYTLKIRAKNKGHYGWSNPAVYNFSIFKVWYARTGIIFILYMSVFLLIYLYVYLHRLKSTKEKKRLEQIIESRTLDLKEQNEELKQLNAKLQVAKEASEAAIKAKDRFFSILAHDLKSPFNTLIGFSELLVHNRDQISEESMEELLGEMLKTSENTYKLLQNLLDWAMSQTGVLKMEPKSILFQDLLDEILPMLEITAKQKEIALTVDVEAELKVFADEAMVATIFRNLLSNAIKFSHKNSTVFISAATIRDTTEIKIRDEGIGMAAEKLVQLFAIDSNTSTQGTANEKGTGLGLMLCHEFIQRSNGSIRVESEPNLGTTFIVTLPSS